MGSKQQAALSIGQLVVYSSILNLLIDKGFAIEVKLFDSTRNNYYFCKATVMFGFAEEIDYLISEGYIDTDYHLTDKGKEYAHKIEPYCTYYKEGIMGKLSKQG